MVSQKPKFDKVVNPMEHNGSHQLDISDDSSTDSDNDSVHSDDIPQELFNCGNKYILWKKDSNPLGEESPQTSLQQIMKPHSIFTKASLHMLKYRVVPDNYQTYFLTNTINPAEIRKYHNDINFHVEYTFILNGLARLVREFDVSYIIIVPEFTQAGVVHTHSIIQFKTFAHAMAFKSYSKTMIGNTDMRQIKREQVDLERTYAYMCKTLRDIIEIGLRVYYFGKYN